MPRSISSKLFVIASDGGEANDGGNVYGSSYYWNFRTSSFKQVACLILKPKNVNSIAKISLGSEPSFIDDFKKAKKGWLRIIQLEQRYGHDVFV